MFVFLHIETKLGNTECMLDREIKGKHQSVDSLGEKKFLCVRAAGTGSRTEKAKIRLSGQQRLY